MNVVVRTDASLRIGTGHVMRCLTLAEELAKRGARVRFVCRDLPGNAIAAITTRGLAVERLPAPDTPYAAVADDYASWLGVTAEQDSTETRALLERTGGADWLVVDHYALGADWERTQRPLAKRILAIDDIANRPHDCDLLLDQNLGSERTHYAHHVPQRCKLLIGTKYAMLRPEFAALRSYSLGRRVKPVLKRLIISAGGLDATNATCKVLTALSLVRLPSDTSLSIVMGSASPHLHAVIAAIRRSRHPVDLHVDTTSMAELLANSDLAIGAMGASAWERCALGVPTLAVIAAENQAAVARRLKESGAVRLIELDERLAQQLADHIGAMQSDNTIISQMSHKARAICDGTGVRFVAAELLEESAGDT